MTTPLLPQQPAGARAAAPAGVSARAARSARSARLSGASQVQNLRPPARLCHLAELVVLRSGLPDWFERQLPQRVNRATGGAVRTLEVRSLLVGMVILALADQPLILRDVAHVLNQLHPSTKHRLNIPRCNRPAGSEAAITERMVSRLWNAMITLIDPSEHSEHNREPYQQRRRELKEQYADLPEALAYNLAELDAEFRAELAHKHAMLRYVLDAGVEGSLPPELVHTGSYAVDSTPIATWASKYRKQGRAPWLQPDPDARRNAKPTRQDSAGWLGYSAHAAVRIPELDGPDVPCLIERIDLTPANAYDPEAGVELLTRMVADHERLDTLAGRPHRPRRDIVADRGYTADVRDAEAWNWPLFDLGFDSHFDLTTHQLEQRDLLSNGAIVIDGQPFSPRTPLALRNLRPPQLQWGTRQDIEHYQQQIAERAKYSLHAVGGRNDDGSWDFGCRAMAQLGQLVCDLKPASLAKPLGPRRTYVDPHVFQPLEVPTICGQQQSRVGPEELPFWQPLLHGSEAHYRSMNRRNRVEGWFGNTKNTTVQDINRGQMRVMGLAKTAFMTMIFAIAANLRLTDTFEAKQKAKADAEANGAAAPKQTRKPRYRTRKLMELREHLAARQAEQQSIADAGQPPPQPPPPDEPLLGDLELPDPEQQH